MDFELTRNENDERLLSQINSIKTAENIDVLIPFAKAYLGMFYVIDSKLTEIEKVKLLVNKELADAIFDGFIASLTRNDVPGIESIGHALAEKTEISEGYVILAALDLIAKKSLTDLKKLNMELIEKAVAFHFSNKSGHTDIWFEYLLSEDGKKLIPIISKYWVVLLKNNVSYLPGRNMVLGDEPNLDVVQYSILPLLGSWTNCKSKTLLELLHLAFKHSEAFDLLKVCEAVLVDSDRLNEKARLYWIAAAFLLSPEKYFSQLSSYTGRVKLKVMPLLDFISLILNDKDKINIKVSDKTIIQLLRMIAPIFPPQYHVYGALGVLDINSRNVMLLFYHLVCSVDKKVEEEIKSLRKARVMKIYSSVIDNLLELHIRKNNEENYSLPGFDLYIENLAKNDCLLGRSNKFDLK